jgi:hypothetical protein
LQNTGYSSFLEYSIVTEKRRTEYKAEPLKFPTSSTGVRVLPVTVFYTLYLTANRMFFVKSALALSLAIVALAAPVTQPRQALAGGKSYSSSCPLA